VISIFCSAVVIALAPDWTRQRLIPVSLRFLANSPAISFFSSFHFYFFLSDEKQDAKMSWPHELASHVSHTIRRPIMIPHVIYSRSNWTATRRRWKQWPSAAAAGASGIHWEREEGMAKDSVVVGRIIV
jgi:hypothetical protein